MIASRDGAGVHPASTIEAVTSRTASVTIMMLHMRPLTVRSRLMSANRSMTLDAAFDTFGRRQGFIDRPWSPYPAHSFDLADGFVLFVHTAIKPSAGFPVKRLTPALSLP